MILDTIENSDFYKNISKNISKALNFLENNDLKNIDAGRHDIDGDKVFALVFDYDTHPEFEDKWEAHRKYFDIQFVASGTEKIALANIIDMIPTTEYIDKDDYQLFKGQGSKLLIRENEFIILGPRDVHQPGIHVEEKPGKVRKVVVKAMI